MAGDDHGVGVVQRLHAAFNDRDKDAFLACLAEDVIWDVEGDNPRARRYEGRAALWEHYFSPLWMAPARVDPHRLEAHGDNVVAFEDAVHNFGQGPRRWQSVEVFTLRDNEVIHRAGFTTNQAELDVFLTRGCAAALQGQDADGVPAVH